MIDIMAGLYFVVGAYFVGCYDMDIAERKKKVSQFARLGLFLLWPIGLAIGLWKVSK